MLHTCTIRPTDPCQVDSTWTIADTQTLHAYSREPQTRAYTDRGSKKKSGPFHVAAVFGLNASLQHAKHSSNVLGLGAQEWRTIAGEGGLQLTPIQRLLRRRPGHACKPRSPSATCMGRLKNLHSLYAARCKLPMN